MLEARSLLFLRYYVTALYICLSLSLLIVLVCETELLLKYLSLLSGLEDVLLTVLSLLVIIMRVLNDGIFYLSLF